MKKLILLASITPMLVGCGITQPNNMSLKAQQAVMTATTACYKSQADIERLRTLSLASVPKEQQALVVMMNQQQEFTKQIVALATGNSYNPCESTNLFDAQIAEVKSRNDAAKNITGGAFGMVPWIVGGFMISDIVSNSAGAMNAGGDIVYKSNGSNNNYQSSKTNRTITGDGNRSQETIVSTPIDFGEEGGNDYYPELLIPEE